MAQDNTINMPSSGGGIMRYSEEGGSRFILKPQHVMILIAVVFVFELILHLYGSSLLG